MSVFAMPTFGDPKQADQLANQLIDRALDLIQELQGFATFTPFSVAFPNIQIDPAPKPILPPDPNLIDVTWTTPTQPAAFTQAPPDISGLFPAPFSVPQPVLSFGSAPQPFVGTVPGAPSINLNFNYPVVNQIDIPPAPQLMSLREIDFNPFDIPDFTGTVPDFTVSPPTPINWTEGEGYTSELLSLIEDEITSALTTDTDIGLSADVQQAMWDAAREREFRAQAAALKDLERMESMGFMLPHGIYLDARIKIQTETQNTTAGLSRDIMVKQAELRLQNVTEARKLGVELESKLIDYANQVQQRAFEQAKYQTEAMIAIYNAAVQVYAQRVEAFKATIQVYDATIRGIEARIEQLKAQVQFEQVKAQIDETLVATYKAQIDAAVATLEVAKVQVQIIQTQASVEKTKVDAYGAQVQAFVATVNAYTAEVEGYKANVEAQGAIENVFKTQVEAYTSVVQAGAEQAKAKIDGYQAQIAGYTASLDGYKASLSAMVEQARAASEYNQAVTEEYKAEVAALSGYNEVLVKEWEAITTTTLQIAEVTSKTAEANVQLQISARQISEEAVKGAAEVMSQLGAAALGAIHWSSTANWSDGQSYSRSISDSTSTSDDHIFSESA